MPLNAKQNGVTHKMAELHNQHKIRILFNIKITVNFY